MTVGSLRSPDHRRRPPPCRLPCSAAQTRDRDVATTWQCPSRATSPEYRRVGEPIAFATTSAPPMITTPERDRVTAV